MSRQSTNAHQSCRTLFLIGARRTPPGLEPLVRL
jgi:hypothetical protein